MKSGCRQHSRNPVIYLNMYLGILTFTFFAIACGLSFSIYSTCKILQNQLEGNSNLKKNQNVYLSATIINGLLFMFSSLSCSFTVDLLNLESNSQTFKQLLKLFGHKKRKIPLSSQLLDEKPRKHDETYQGPMVHLEGPAIFWEKKNEKISKAYCHCTMCPHVGLGQKPNFDFFNILGIQREL